MAKLPEPAAGSGVNIDNEAPPGQYIATCVKIIDQFGVQRQKFQSPEMVKKDITRFIFGVYGPNKSLFLIQTFEFTISSSKDANLMEFLTAWCGAPPQIGWDYCEMEGKGAAIVVASVPSKRNPSKSYAQITSIGPVFPQMMPLVAPAKIFAALLEKALSPQGKTAPAPSSPAPQGSPWNTPNQPLPAEPTTPPAATPGDDDIPF